MTFQSDYVPIWESGASVSASAEDDNRDFEDSVTFEATDASSNADGIENGPLTATVEQSGWTTDDVMMALTAANVVLFAALLYIEWGGR
ncbi:hypothetical protein VB779_15710 [Haloarculaceae archaeon H-GB11]|nr:hypothetical protein [Haloarculaceae archaeon H-GB11]